MTSYDVDFLPPDWRARRARRRHAMTRGAIAGFVALVLIAIHAHSLREHARLDDQLELVDAEYGRARDRIQRVEELERKKQELKRRLDQLKDVLKRAHGAAIASAISEAVPDDIVLKKLEFHFSEVASMPVYEVTILGISPDNKSPLDFSDRLTAKRPLLTLVRVPSMKEYDAAGRREFVLTSLAPGMLELPLAEILDAGLPANPNDKPPIAVDPGSGR